MAKTGTEVVKRGMAEMQKGGVIMDVVNAEQAKIAEAAGAVAVMALERVPSDIRAAGGVARMADPTIVEEVMNAVSIPVMAKCRIGHIVEARVLEALGVDYIDESEVLTPADDKFHLNKKAFTVPFVCGARDLGEALRRIAEGASMIRTKGEPGTGNIVEAVKHQRMMQAQIRKIQNMSEDELVAEAKNLGAPYELSNTYVVSRKHKKKTWVIDLGPTDEGTAAACPSRWHDGASTWPTPRGAPIRGRLDRELDAIMVLAPTNQPASGCANVTARCAATFSPSWSIRTFHRMTMAARGNCGPQPHTAKSPVDFVPSGEPICSLAFDPSSAPQHDGEPMHIGQFVPS